MPRQRFSRPEPRKSKSKPYKWLGEWHVYQTVGGKEKRVHRGPKVLGLCAAMTKADAQAKLDELIASDRAPKDQKPEGPETLGWAVRQHLHLSKSQWEPETHATLRGVAKHFSPLADLPLASVTREQLQGLLNDLASSGKSQSFMKKARALLSSVFMLATADGKVTRNPMLLVKMPKTRKPEKRYLTKDEFARLIAAANSRDRIIIGIAGVLGLRPGELFGLKWGDVDFERLQVRVDESARNGVWKRPKTEASEGYVHLPPSLAAELMWWKSVSVGTDDSALVFPSARKGKPIRQNNYLKRELATIAKNATVEGVTFQALRRTTATHAQHVGTVKDVQGMLRHASPDMTVGTYMQTVPESQKAATEALAEMLMKERVM